MGNQRVIMIGTCSMKHPKRTTTASMMTRIQKGRRKPQHELVSRLAPRRLNS
jgi:hypothetical protein